MVKYRIAQKGDKYQAQCKNGFIGSWIGFNWSSSKEACEQLFRWKLIDGVFDKKITYHKPEDICGEC